MCGINAIIKKKGIAEISDIRRMGSVLQHRGPDGAGFASLKNGAILFGHNRLSIIDFHEGHQPLFNQDGSVCITFNGEIYDYKSHREDLLRRGHLLRTQSDTEVIVHLYDEFGLDFIHKLNGEFAFVIWDEKKQLIMAARDRAGVKPLFYYENNDEILISSEVKGIFALPRVPRAINPDYMMGPVWGAFPASVSAFKNIQSLKPGHFLMVDVAGIASEKKYWQHSFQPNHNGTFQEAKEDVRRLLTQAVERRMVADVPVGAYLSGGLDSTLVCGLMAARSNNVKAFSVGFGNTIYDESNAARQIAQHYGAQFEAIDCNDELLAENFLKTVHHAEQPMVNPNSIAKQVLSQLVRARGYKVCLTGEGADEVFGGYAYFKQEHLWRMMLAGGDESTLGKDLYDRFRTLESRSEGILWNRGNKWKKISPLFGYPSFHHLRALESNLFSRLALQKSVIDQSVASTPEQYFEQQFSFDDLSKMDPFNASKRITFNQLSSYIIPTLGDRVEMANSVECRTPFLDRDLLEYTSTLDPKHFMDINTLREKHLLKQAFSDMLPQIVKQVHKHPFLSPSWLSLAKTKMGRELKGEFLSSGMAKKAGIFNPSFLRRIKFYWKVLPVKTNLWKRVDVMSGLLLTTHALHQQFVEKPQSADPDFGLVDRSWGRSKFSSANHFPENTKP